MTNNTIQQKKHGENYWIERKIKLAGEVYPHVYYKLAGYFIDQGVTPLQLMKAKKVIDLVDDDNVNAFMIELAELFRYSVNNQ